MTYLSCMPGPLWPTEALGVRSAGMALLAPGWRHARGRVADRANFYWGTAGIVRFRTDGVERELHADEILYFPPDHKMEPSALDCRGRYCWMTLCGPLAAAVLEHAGLRRGIPFRAPACPENRFRQLLELLHQPSPENARAAEILAYEIILIAAAHHAEIQLPGREPARQAKALLDEHYAEAAFNIDALAAMLARHRTGVSRNFKEVYGLAPIEYLMEKRLARAATLLQSQSWPVARTARACGFTDAGYFSRCFHRRYGMAPGAFRRGYLAGTL